MEDKTIALIAIGGMITTIEIAAIIAGINGQLFLSSIGALTTIFGYFIGKKSTSYNPPHIPKSEKPACHKILE
ncbi:unnamed protein product [marine sediment metagenome]|uniref:Uncharacterized protein n=1 Tax=marine sediment metagenome TaxID=412755 RepID=X1IWW8_9ZZZZ